MCDCHSRCRNANLWSETGAIRDPCIGHYLAVYGKHGERPATVLSHWCWKKQLLYQVVSGEDHSHATRALDSGRIIVASLFLSKYQWTLFSGFFKKYPARALSRSDFEKVSRCPSEFPSNLCKSSGHAVVVMGYSKDCQGKIVYKIKNS